MEDINISVIICTINTNFALRAVRSLIGHVGKDDEVIVIVDGREYLHTDTLIGEIHQNGWKIIVNEANMGLSYCRNLGLASIRNPYCVFFDDDVIVTDTSVARYKEDFSKGYDMVGGVLKLPEDYPPIPAWFPDGMTSLLGIHSFQKKIWGASFGFRVEPIREKGLQFQAQLGRKGRGLESGDDTSFIYEYCRDGTVAYFDDHLVVYHCIDRKRYRYEYMLRRSYWQGISEVRRNNFVTGLKKELHRAAQIDFKHKPWAVILKVMTSFTFIVAFLVGAIKEKVV